MEYTGCLQHLHWEFFQRDIEIEWTRDSGSRGGIAARLGLLGDRGHFCTAAPLCNSVSQVVLKEKGRISQSDIWGKVPAFCPGSAASLLCMGKAKEKGELVTDAGKRPHVEAEARTSTGGKTEGGMKTN